MDRRKNVNPAKGIIDFVCIALVMSSVGMFYLWGKPYQRGFFCNDESLRYPVKESTISSLMLYVSGSVPHIFMIMAGEYFYWKETDGKSSFLISGGTVPYWIAMAYNKISLFVYGIGMTLITTNIAKYTIGRLNPQFIEVCKPSINCTLENNQHLYIEKFECTEIDVSSTVLKNLRLSFPSGHASFAAFVMVWTVLEIAFRTGYSSASAIIGDTYESLWNVLQTQMVPPSEENWIRVANEFYERWNFLHCIGAADGKHGVIKAPPKSGSTFYNCKGSHGINLMATASALYRFLLVDIGAKG